MAGWLFWVNSNFQRKRELETCRILRFRNVWHSRRRHIVLQMQRCTCVFSGNDFWGVLTFITCTLLVESILIFQRQPTSVKSLSAWELQKAKGKRNATNTQTRTHACQRMYPREIRY
jgi:hypothetical protein